MSDPAILFVKPKAISAKDKKALQSAGVIVVEVENVNDVKLTRASPELAGSEILRVALRAIKRRADDQIFEFLGREIAEALLNTPKANVKSTA